MSIVQKIILPLLFASALAEWGEPLSDISARPSIADACPDSADATKGEKVWTAEAEQSAEEKKAAEEAKLAEETMAARRAAEAMLELIRWRYVDSGGVIFLYLILACMAAVGCAFLGGLLKQNLFGSGPVKVSSAASPVDGRWPGHPALLIDEEGRVLAARQAQLSVPLDYAPVLTTGQWEGICRVHFTRQQEDGKESISSSNDVVERTWDGRTLTLLFKSGRSLSIEGRSFTLLSADGTVLCPVVNGALCIAQFHVLDQPELHRKAQGFYAKHDVDL